MGKGLYRLAHPRFACTGRKSGGGSGVRAMRAEVGDDPSPLTRGAGASAAQARLAGVARMAVAQAAGREVGRGCARACRAGPHDLGRGPRERLRARRG